LGKKVIRAVEDAESPYEVIDMVAEELRREVKSFKGKQKTREIRGARTIKRILKKPLA
jgi:ribosome-associated translation inhibitor RaiA